MRLNNCNVISLPKVSDTRGNLTFVENNKHLPFNFQRVFYIYDVPNGGKRGAHAHREQQQLLIALSGSFDVTLDDGINKKRITLSNAAEGLHIQPLVWGELDNFSAGSICLVLVSASYDEDDYLRNYENFLKVVKGTHHDCPIS